jgi:WD40 repeat protein
LPGGRLFAAALNSLLLPDGSRRRTLVCLDVIKGKISEMTSVEPDASFDLSFSPRGTYLLRECAGGGDDRDRVKTLHVFECATGRLLGRLTDVVAWHWDLIDENLLIQTPIRAGAHRLEVWRPLERKTIATHENVGAESVLSADGSTLLLWGTATTHRIIWNVKMQRVQGEFHNDGGVVIGGETLSPDGRWSATSVVTWDGPQIELRDLQDVKRPPRVIEKLRAGEFSPDGRFLACESDRTSISIVNSADGKVIWRDAMELASCVFSKDGQTAIVMADVGPASSPSLELVCRDAATGELRKRTVLSTRHAKGTTSLVQQTADRALIRVPEAGRGDQGFLARLPWIGDHFADRRNDLTIVIDTRTGEELLCLHGLDTGTALLSEDGEFLATHHRYDSGSVVRCWRVDAGKPIGFAVGIPAGLGGLFVLMRLAWRRGEKSSANGMDSPK